MRHPKILTISLILSLFGSCSDSCPDEPDSNVHVTDGNKTVLTSITSNDVNTLCLDWGATMVSVRSKMKSAGYTESVTETDELEFTNKKQNIFMRYGFEDGQLVIAGIVFIVDKNNYTVYDVPVDYEYIGRILNCGELYASKKSNLLMQRSCKTNYTLGFYEIGFCPLE